MLGKNDNDPPGMDIQYVPKSDPFVAAVHDGWWVYVGRLCITRRDDKDAARAAAWVWHDRRRALYERLKLAEVVMRTFIVDDLWPLMLTWTDGQVAEVENWLRDSTAEMPGVLE